MYYNNTVPSIKNSSRQLLILR